LLDLFKEAFELVEAFLAAAVLISCGCTTSSLLILAFDDAGRLPRVFRRTPINTLCRIFFRFCRLL